MEWSSTCPWCGKVNNRVGLVVEAGDAGGAALPEPGDKLLCITCGKFSIADAKGLHKPNKAERREIDESEEARVAIASWRAMNAAITKH